jgi:VanZ family protein
MDRIYRLISSPNYWFAGYLVWFVALFVLSSISVGKPDGPEIPHLDKVLHTTYFTLGSATLGVGLLLKIPRLSPWRLLAILVLAAFVVGGFDEWHQSHTPGRSGNDLGDLTADCLGGLLGFFVVTQLFWFASRRGFVAKVVA